MVWRAPWIHLRSWDLGAESTQKHFFNSTSSLSFPFASIVRWSTPNHEPFLNLSLTLIERRGFNSADSPRGFSVVDYIKYLHYHKEELKSEISLSHMKVLTLIKAKSNFFSLICAMP